MFGTLSARYPLKAKSTGTLQSSSMKITVVIPTFNEATNLPKLVGKLFALAIPSLHILVVDDDSPDGTGDLADQFITEFTGRFSVIHRSGKQGLGTAYIAGFQRALLEGAEVVVQMDADFSHPPEKLPGFIDSLKNCDMVLGSRYVTGGAVDERWPFWRKSLSAFGNWYARTVLRFPIRDATGGYRVWRRETLLGMPIEMVKSNGYAFQVEMAYIAYRLGYTIHEVPFYFADRQWGTSKMSFAIQREAAVRVWEMLYQYRHLQPMVSELPQ